MIQKSQHKKGKQKVTGVIPLFGSTKMLQNSGVVLSYVEVFFTLTVQNQALVGQGLERGKKRSRYFLPLCESQ